MVSKTINHYRVTEKIGKGGMGWTFNLFGSNLESAPLLDQVIKHSSSILTDLD
jgi:hypothetical protein